MISLAKARQILRAQQGEYTDDEIQKLLIELGQVAEVCISVHESQRVDNRGRKKKVVKHTVSIKRASK
jgi:hypothetical protein